MRALTLLFVATSIAAGAEQPSPKQPPKLFIGPKGVPAPRTTGALMKQCPKAVSVTNQPAQAQYRLDLTSYYGPTIFQTHYNAVLFNRAGDSVATFEATSPKKLAAQVCGYFQVNAGFWSY